MAGMTKEDRAEYESRLAACGYWEALSHTQALAYGLASKREFLARKRKEEALAALSDGERAYALECLADGATLEDAIEAAKEAAKRLEEADKEEAKKVFYTFTWCKEEGGDFYEQPFEANSLQRALERWQDFWGLDESTCFLFEVKKGGI